MADEIKDEVIEKQEDQGKWPVDKKDFNRMVSELLDLDEPEFNTLAVIVTAYMTPKVNNKWFYDSRCFSQDDRDDFMQDLLLHFILVTIDQFFLSKDEDGNYKYVRDVKVFCKWMQTHAFNMFLNYWHEKKRCIPKEELIINADGIRDVEEKIANNELLKKAFSIVMTSGSNLHIIFTWIMQSLIVLGYDVTRIDANEKLLERYSDQNMSDIYIDLLRLSDCFEWLEISEKQHEMFLKELKTIHGKSGCRYGETLFNEHFMRDEGKKSGKKSISNWVNRMDNKIKNKLHVEYNETNENEGGVI